jgi:hypothetical protein
MIRVGDIVESGVEGNCYYGVIVDVSDDNFFCWIHWFDFGVEKARTTYLKVLTQ